MLCESCNQNEATMHLTQVVDGVVKKLHLCEACATESGFDLQGPMSITDMLLGMGQEPSVPKTVDISEKHCPSCGMRRSDFKKTSRLGCPNCYEAFELELPPLLKAIHRSETHVGKVPSGEDLTVKMSSEIAALREALQDAVGKENFEEAARLRDEIRKCQERLDKGEGHDD